VAFAVFARIHCIRNLSSITWAGKTYHQYRFAISQADTHLRATETGGQFSVRGGEFDGAWYLALSKSRTLSPTVNTPSGPTLPTMTNAPWSHHSNTYNQRRAAVAILFTIKIRTAWKFFDTA